MKLYDFSAYAQERNERSAARAVAAVGCDINKVGAVIELKSKVTEWFKLHKEIEKLRA